MTYRSIPFLTLGLVFLLSSTAFGWDDFEDEPPTPTAPSGAEDGEDDGEAPEADEAEAEGDPQEGDPAETEPEGEELEEFSVDGRRVYLICIFGPRDRGIVTRKCAQVEPELERAYGARWVTRLNNPSAEQLQRIQDRVGHDIGAVLVVTHSTPDPTDESGFDVWDCEMDPDDFAEIFEDQWVIWNGCFSRSICELADNILPTQCEDGVLDSGDDTWREIMRCLDIVGNDPQDRDAICRRVFGEDWMDDEE